MIKLNINGKLELFKDFTELSNFVKSTYSEDLGELITTLYKERETVMQMSEKQTSKASKTAKELYTSLTALTIELEQTQTYMETVQRVNYNKLYCFVNSVTNLARITLKKHKGLPYTI